MERILKKISAVVLFSLISLANFAGCHKPQEIGSCHIAVLSVTQWDDYKSELQPNFQLTGEKALEKVIPDTLLIESAIYDSLRAKIGAKIGSPYQALKTDSTTTDNDSDDDDSDDNNDDAKNKSGLPEYTSKIREGQTKVTDQKLGQDACLAYLAATALFQEVKLLNRYTQDACTAKHYKPYIVRLQLSQMPFRRKQPLDLYLNIGFFADKKDSKKSDSDQNIEIASTMNVEMPILNSTSNTQSDSEIEFKSDYEPCERLPIVIPLLATDQIEGALESRQMEKLRQLILSLSVAYAGAGGSFDLEAINERLQRAVGRSHNSLFTIGQITQNMIRVRLGARQIANEEACQSYEAIPRTHNISVLLLVPIEEDEADKSNDSVLISIMTRLVYRDAVTGKRFGGSNDNNPKDIEKKIRDELWGKYGNQWADITGFTEKLRKIKTAINNKKNLSKWKRDKKIKEATEEKTKKAKKELYNAAEDILNGRYNDYMKRICVAGGKPSDMKIMGRANFLWFDLNELGIFFDYDITTFEIHPYPKKLQVAVIPNNRAAVLADNGEKTIAKVYKGKGKIPDNISATWKFDFLTKNADKKNVPGTCTLAATKIEAEGDYTIVLTFPSASRYGLTPKFNGIKKSFIISYTEKKKEQEKEEKVQNQTQTNEKTTELAWIYKSIPKKDNTENKNVTTTQPSKVIKMDIKLEASGESSASKTTENSTNQ